jgi:tripartite-type tricarboxylate transporter receptor subunit TctC
MRRSRWLSSGAWALLAVAVSTSASAAWPDRPITLVAPYPPGGNADAMARIVAQGLSAQLGRPVVVDNRSGAGGMLGSQHVARSRPDGYTFLLGALSNVLNEFMYQNRTFDLRRDLVAVSQVASIPNYFAVTPSATAETLAGLIDEARANPGLLTCATSGIGTSGHLACEMVRQRAGVDVLMVHYRGGAPAMADVMAGRARLLAINEALPYIRDGRLRGLAVTSPQRSPMAPELPPASDTVPGFDLVSWYGVFAPARTPPDIIGKVSAAVAATLSSRESGDRLAALGATPVGSPPQEFAEFVDRELVRWETIITPMNIVLD